MLLGRHQSRRARKIVIQNARKNATFITNQAIETDRRGGGMFHQIILIYLKTVRSTHILFRHQRHFILNISTPATFYLKKICHQHVIKESFIAKIKKMLSNCFQTATDFLTNANFAIILFKIINWWFKWHQRVLNFFIRAENICE